MLSEIAQRHGYALAAHGSLQSDFDLVAIPWVENCSDAHAIKNEFVDYLNVAICLFGTGVDGTPELKPHGRQAWNLHLGNSAKIDLSVMPKTPEPRAS